MLALLPLLLTTTTQVAAAAVVKNAAGPSSGAGIDPTFLGRVNPATRELSWPSTGIRFTFQGSAASVPVASVTGNNAVDIIIDGGAPIVFNAVDGSTKLSTPSTLTDGTHTFELRKKSEALFGSVFIGQPTVTGTLINATAVMRRIEIIGDSISVGYGLDGTLPCTNTAALEDGPKTYGALTAGSLGYDYSIVSWSGRGVTRNYVSTTVDTSPLAPELWTRYGANDADDSYDFKTPVDIVVVNLGTNDFGYVIGSASARPPIVPSEYTAAMVKFGKQIQAKYPDAELFFTSSPMLNDDYPSTQDAQHTTQSNALKDVVSQLGSKAHFVNFPPQNSSSLACDYHPNASAHEQMASILEAAIKQVVQ